MARYFRFPFARQGDKVVFPDATQADGTLSYNQGYGPDFQRTPGTDPQAKRLDRSRFNQLMFDITSTLQLYYQEAYPNFITPANNGGTAFPYPQYARVRYNPGASDRIYESLKDNNTSLPTVTADWRLVDFAGMDARYLTQTTADGRYIQGTLGTSTGNIPRIGTPGTTTAGDRSAVVVRDGSNTNGRYRIYSDGYRIQTRRNITVGARSTATFTFPVAFTNTNTIFVICNRSTGDFTYSRVLPCSEPTLTTVTIDNSDSSFSATGRLFAVGF